MKMDLNNRIIDIVILLKNSCIQREDSIREEFSISPAEYRAILAICPGEKTTGGSLSKKMDLSISRGSRIIEKLMNKEYIRQVPSDKDRRCQMLILTEKGIRLRNKIDSMLNKCEDEIKSKIPHAEMGDIINSLQKLTIILNSNNN
jgi:DNA-binding MarR family transcriptional regulator